MARLILVVLFIGNTICVAQTNSILHEQILYGTYEEKYNALEELIDRYNYDQLDSLLWASHRLVSLAKENERHEDLALAYKLLGNSYTSSALYEKAIDSYYTAIHYYDSLGGSLEDANVASCYHNLGWVYTHLEEYDRVLDLFNRSLTAKELNSRDDSINYAISYHAIGSFYYLYDSQYDSAEVYLEKTVRWRKSFNGAIETIAQAQVELRHALLLNRKFKKADALSLDIQSHPADSISEYVVQYENFLNGLYLYQTNDFKGALKYFLSTYDWITQSGNQHSEIGINALKQIVKTYEKAGLYEDAFANISLLRSLEQESIFKNRQRTTKSLEIENETARKEQLISAQQDRLSLQTHILWISISASVIILLLAIVLFWSRNNIRKKNIKIEMLMRELHHRVKNNLQVISSLLGLQSMKLEDANAKNAVAEGKQRLKAMSLIHQKLYQQDEVSTLNIREYMTDLVNDLANSYGFPNNGHLNIDIPSMSMHSDTSLPLGLIVNELVTNALKYAYADIEKPMLELKLTQEDKKYFMLSIKDNGIGLPQNFDLSKAESFGLKLVNLLMRQIKGTILVDQDNGLTYYIKFQTV